MCSNAGPQTAVFYLEIQDGSPITFYCNATFSAPKIKLIESIANFGLSKINTIQKYRLTIQNINPIPAEILIKSTRFDELKFDTYERFKLSGKRPLGEVQTLDSNTLKF
jgi:hypothetical protein